jgi:MYXO-CTERM domain-containing protein
MYDRGESQLLVQQGELPYIHAKEVLAIQFISSHPLQFAQLTVKRVFRFWLGSTHSPLPMDAFLPVLGLAGITMLRRRSISTLFMLPLVLFPLPYYITHVEPRYRFVIDPLLAILAGFACESFFAWCARRPAPAATLASVR